jgi:hypothetical protein
VVVGVAFGGVGVCVCVIPFAADDCNEEMSR